MRIAIIIGSTRPSRNGEAVGKWVYELSNKRDDAEFKLIDLIDFDLPLLDEPLPASMGQYSHAHTKKWVETIASFDGFVFVTPEYNHSVPAALKNAIDFLYKEWNNKSAGFVGYGGAGAIRAIEHLRLTMAELQIADVRTQVSLSLVTDFENYSVLKPAQHHERSLHKMLNEIVAWGRALRELRTESVVATSLS